MKLNPSDIKRKLSPEEVKEAQKAACSIVNILDEASKRLEPLWEKVKPKEIPQDFEGKLTTKINFKSEDGVVTPQLVESHITGVGLSRFQVCRMLFLSAINPMNSHPAHKKGFLEALEAVLRDLEGRG